MSSSSKVKGLDSHARARRSAYTLAQYRPYFNATITGRTYTPDYWNGTEPSASLMCYVGIPHGIMLFDAFDNENPYDLGPRYIYNI